MEAIRRTKKRNKKQHQQSEEGASSNKADETRPIPDKAKSRIRRGGEKKLYELMDDRLPGVEEEQRPSLKILFYGRVEKKGRLHRGARSPSFFTGFNVGNKRGGGL